MKQIDTPCRISYDPQRRLIAISNGRQMTGACGQCAETLFMNALRSGHEIVIINLNEKKHGLNKPNS